MPATRALRRATRRFAAWLQGKPRRAGIAKVAAFALVGCGMLWSANEVIEASGRRLVEREAVKVAEVVARQAAALGAIQQGAAASLDDGYSWRVIQRGGVEPLDELQRQAFASLGTRECLWAFTSVEGRRVLRYIRPVGSAGSSPQAIVEVLVPVEQATAFAAVQSRVTQSLVLALGLVGFALVTLLAVRSARAHRSLAQRYETLAKVDALTDLPNRLALEQHMREVLAEARREGRGLGVMFVDLDNFKNVNDSLGHRAGDHVLRTVAKRLAEALRHSDLVARYSGDEFVVLVGDAENARHLGTVAAKLIEAVAPVMSVHSTDIFVTLSIGIAMFPLDGADAPTLLKHADSAMYRAKEKGRHGYEFFAAEMNQSAVERLQMSSSLRHALSRQEFLVHYQPKAEARGQRIVGFEALVRWQHPQKGLLSPAKFIPHAESSGAIEPLGEWVLDAALAQLGEWRSRCGFEGTMAVNLSMRQLYNADLPQAIAAALARHGIPAAMLELEVTESMVSTNPEMAARTLHEIAALGVSIALDDFGTGQSSLSCLLRFPIRTLKVDRTFTSDVLESEDARAIVRAIIALAHGLRLRLVAEGVESEDHRRFFQQEGCDEIQGYLIAWPMPADEAAVFAFPRKARSIAALA